MVVTLRRIGFRLLALTRLRRYLYYRYQYSFTPSQLCFLIECLDRTSEVEGAVVEIGCAFGHTTVFLDKHLSSRGDQRNYVCIDTFSGFTDDDVAFEREARGKHSVSYAGCYSDASLQHFQRTLANNGVTRVKPIQADVRTHDLDSLGPISFCLIDVDLYLPVQSALEKVMKLVSPGGIVVVDDCQDHPLWDGAWEAYREFTAQRSITPQIVEGQFGLLEF